MSAADDLNAEFTANRWLAEDLRPFAELIGATLGDTQGIADFILHTWRDSGMDIVLARAAYELESL